MLPVVSAELEDLARAHLALWLAAGLPRTGACLVIDRDAVLAKVLASTRAVALATPNAALAEVAAGQCEGQVAISVGIPDDLGPLSSAVVVVRARDDVAELVRQVVVQLADDATLAVVVTPGQVALAISTVEATGRRTRSYPQVIRAASCLGGGENGLLASDPGAPVAPLPVAVAVVAGPHQPTPTAMLGRDLSPAVLRATTAGLSESLREAHLDNDRLGESHAALHDVRRQLLAAEQQLAVVPQLEVELAQAQQQAQQQAQHWAARQEQELEVLLRREEELEVLRTHAENLDNRLKDLLDSTSWRASAPLRVLSARLRRA